MTPATATQRPELLAPAGGREALKAALLAGADAVYLGGPAFGARATAENFDAEGLAWARRVTRRLGRRMYVTVNTLIFDPEWPALEAYLDLLEEVQPDALIVQDLGLLSTLARRGSRIRRHLSTQAAWDGAGGADLLAELGVVRVILPRETPLTVVERVVRDGPFRVEVFVHGSHCYSVSGRCWWSVALGPRSGNRGTCAQPCRRLYADAEGQAEAQFSPRDLRLVARLEGLARAGVAALKIEGRLKGASSVGKVVSAYRAVLDGRATAEGASEGLDAAFTREWCEGFVDGEPGTWRTTVTVGGMGQRVGTIHRPPGRDGRALVAADRPIRPGDGLAWSEGAERRGDRVTHVQPAGAGQVALRFRGEGPRAAGAVLYRTDDEADGAAGPAWDPAWEDREVTLRFAGRVGEPLRCRFEAERAQGEVASGDRLDRAQAEGLEAILADRFGRLNEAGATARVDVSALGTGLFLRPSALKALRRALVAALVEAAVPPRELRLPPPGPVAAPLLPGAPPWALRAYQAEAVEALAGLAPPLGFVIPLAAASLASRLRGSVGYALPPVFGPDGLERLARELATIPPAELLCPSWEAFALARRAPQHRYRLDWTFNVANARAAAVLAGQGLAATGCPEVPAPVPGTRAVWAVNPLVSLSRFPPEPGAPAVVTNDHGDRFHRVRLGEAWALFLERWPTEPPPLAAEVQVDVFLPPGAPLARLHELLTRLGPVPASRGVSRS
jgi:putative protease